MEDKEKNTQIPVIRLDRQLKYEGNILKIYEDKVLANGHEARWDFIHHDGAAAVLPVADDGKILMVRQYRNALDRYTLEIPAGKLDAPGEPKVECAFRELEEETGYRVESPENLEYLMSLTTTVAFCDEAIDIFVAHNLIPSHQNLDEDEVINVVPCSLEELEDMVLEKGSDIPFNHEISGYRRKVSLFSHYYLQLADLSSILCEDDNHIFKEKEKRSFSLLTERVNRLHDETLMLRDYCVQIREVYQSLIDERQNEIMKLLTIVTTIVLPLSLVAGWYGMNFTNMPELTWHYGYGFIILLSIVITILNILYFKKKKFW